MIIKYAWKRLRSSFWEMAVETATVFLCLLLILFLNSLIIDQRTNLNDVYENMEITCVVTNAAGTAQTGLGISSEYVTMMESGGLSEYVRDATYHAKAMYLLLGEEQIPFHLISAPKAVEIFSQDGIDYREGCGEEDFFRGEAVAVIPAFMMSAVTADGMLTLELPPHRLDAITFRVIGTYPSEKSAVYVPYEVGEAFLARHQRQFVVDSLSFAVADNRELNRTKVRLGDYFIAASPFVNEDSKKPGLQMDDAVFVDTVTVLERSIALFTLFQTVLFCLSIGICFFVTFLLVRRRRSELAVMRSLGCRPRLIYGQVLWEQVMTFIVGAWIAIAAIAMLKLSHDMMSWILMGEVLACWLIGSMLSVAVVTSGDMMKILKGKE